MPGRFSIFTLLGILVFTFGSTAQTPQGFSNKIGASTEELYAKAALWGTTFISQYNGKQDYSELMPLRVEMQEYIEEQLSYFTDAKDIGGSEKLKAAVIAFYQYEQDLVKNSFQPFEKLTSSSSDELINSCRQKLKDEAERESGYTSAINAARKEYAANNNFSLDPPPPAPKPAPIKKPAAQKPATSAKPAQGSAAPKEPVKKPAKEEDDDKEEE